jgi:hypothetical protein
MGSDLQRSCARRSCRLDARPAGKLCRDHHAEAMRTWRKLRKLAGLPLAGATRTAPSSSPPAVLARVKLHRNPERQPGPCAACRKRDGVVGAHIDPSDPGAITWCCRGCRHTLVLGQRQRREDEAADAALARQRREAEESERAAIAQRAAVVANWRSAIERLASEPAEVVAAIRAEAASFRGMRLTEDSQMFRQRLAQLAERHFSIKIGLSADRQ